MSFLKPCDMGMYRGHVGAVLVGNSIPTYRDIKEEYYKFYMTDQQGKMTEEKSGILQ